MKLPGPRKAWIGGVAVLAIVLVVTLTFDMAAGFALKSIIQSVTGTKVHADRIHLSVLRGTLIVRNMRVMSPRGFPKGKLAYIPTIDVSFDTFSFFSATPRIHELKVHVREIVVVKNKDGQLNVDALNISHGTDNEPTKISVSKFVLSLDRVIQRDLTGAKPVIQLHEIALKEATYEDLPGASKVIGVVLGQALQSAAIKGALIYGTAAVAGIAFLPVGAAILMAGKDDAESDVRASYQDAFRASRITAEALGKVTQVDRKTGQIKASANGADVTIEVSKVSIGKSHVKVSARKLLMPQPKSAGGVLYEIMEITG